MRVKWLHISDIHHSYAGFDNNLARKDLVKFLQRKGEEVQFTDLIVTGDVLFKYAKPSKDTITFLHDVVQAMGISMNNVWIVPGNHDHCRNSCVEILTNIYSAKDPNLAVDELSSEEITVLLDSFQYYKDFCSQFYGSSDIYDSRKLHWYATNQDNCSVIGLNTAWLEMESKEDSAIHIGLKPLMEALGGVQQNTDAINIAIGHHPIDKLASKDQERVLDLFRRNNILLYLCGHDHGAGATYYEEAGVLQIDAAGLLIDGQSYGGYCIGTIDTDSKNYKVEFFRWCLSNENWKPERSRSGVSIDGICYFEQIKNAKKPSSIVVDAKLFGEPIPDSSIYDAIQETNAEIVRFRTTDVTGTIDEKRWEVLRSELREIIKVTSERRGEKCLCIFPMAPLPLLVEMGYIYQHNSAVSLWQYNRVRDRWVQNDRSDPKHKLEIQENLLKKAGELLVTVATSASIYDNQVNSCVSICDCDSIKFYTCEKTVGFPIDAQVVRQYAQIVFSNISPIVANYDGIHLFIAVPAGLAVEIGRWFQSNMFPKIHLYHNQAGYQYAYTINTK